MLHTKEQPVASEGLVVLDSDSMSWSDIAKDSQLRRVVYIKHSNPWVESHERRGEQALLLHKSRECIVY